MAREPLHPDEARSALDLHQQGGPMESATAQLVSTSPPLFDEARLAVGGFLARYSGNTRSGYASDLRGWFAWCAQVGLEPSPCSGSTSSSTPAGWRRTATWPGPPSAGGCRPSSASTASPSS